MVPAMTRLRTRDVSHNVKPFLSVGTARYKDAGRPMKSAQVHPICAEASSPPFAHYNEKDS